jgi:CheY-like chemotaxis protein/HPt (histidine-containing phosphotransfer) domain-containing protein
MMARDERNENLAAVILSNLQLAETRLVMLGPVGSQEDETVSQLTGIKGYVNKPVRRKQLYESAAVAMGLAVEPSPSKDRPILKNKKNVKRFDAQVLLVEDNPVNQEVVSAMLANVGCRTDLATTGKEALAAVRDGAYDLVFMDCQMPEMDGYEATRRIRNAECGIRNGKKANPKSQVRLPIVAMTAHAIKGERERCMDAGMDDYLSKPFDQVQLHAILERWVAHKAVAQKKKESKRKRPEKKGEAPPKNSGVEDDTIDQRALDTIQGLQRKGAPSILERVISQYLESAPSLLASARDAEKKGDASALEKAAHSLKSSSGNVGAVKLVALCKEIETKAREGNLDDMSSGSAALDAEYKKVRGALEKELKRRAG